MAKFTISILMLCLLSNCSGYYGYVGPGESCFIAGTPIQTPSGDRSIETIMPGDYVYSYDKESQQIVVGVVDDVMKRNVDEINHLTLSNGTILSVTRDHPFYLPDVDEWVPVAQLKVGDRLARIRDDFNLDDTISVAKIEIVRSQAGADKIVYNFKVREYMTSFASDILVHFYGI